MVIIVATLATTVVTALPSLLSLLGVLLESPVSPSGVVLGEPLLSPLGLVLRLELESVLGLEPELMLVEPDPVMSDALQPFVVQPGSNSGLGPGPQQPTTYGKVLEPT